MAEDACLTCRAALPILCFFTLLLTWNTLHFTDQEKKHFVGARLASGQDISCKQLIIDPSFKIPTLDVPSDSNTNLSRSVARGICIFSKSLKQGSSNVLVVFPPKCKKNYSSMCDSARSPWCSHVAMVVLLLLVDSVSTLDLALEEEQVAAVRLLQLSSNLAICPPGM